MKKTRTSLLILLAATIFLGCQSTAKVELKNIETASLSERKTLSVSKESTDLTNEGWNNKSDLLLRFLGDLHEKTDMDYDYMRDFTDKLINRNGKTLELELEKYNHTENKDLLSRSERGYLEAINSLREELKSHPRTKSANFWHNASRIDEMWLDDEFMGKSYYAKYNVGFSNNDKLDNVVRQFGQIQSHLKGLNENKAVMTLSDKSLGGSPEFWLSSLGWYAMALVDVIDILPEDYDKRKDLITYLNDLSASLVGFQDNKTGLWYQIPAEAASEDNYPEASGSAMIIYSFARAAHQGYLDQQYLAAAQKAYDGIVENLISLENNGSTNIKQVSTLTEANSMACTYQSFLEKLMVEKDMDTLSPFILASLEMDK